MNAEIGRIIRAANLEGFGGHCCAAAVAINTGLFDGAGALVGAFNLAFQTQAGHYIGHVAVLFEGVYWDADGRPKPWDEIESWGMLDPYDPDYAQLALDAAIEWDEIVASETIRIEDADQIHRAFSTEMVAEMSARLSRLARRRIIHGHQTRR